MRFRVSYAALFAVMALVGTANAAIFMNITDIGGGSVRLQFSGSARLLTSTANPNSLWVNNSSFTGTPFNVGPGSRSVASGSGTVTVASTTSAVTDVWNSTFGFAPRASIQFPYAVGAVVGWSGDLTTGHSFSDFNPGVYTTRTLMHGTIDEDFVLTIGRAATEVPEPGTLAIWSLLGVGALVFRRRRRA